MLCTIDGSISRIVNKGSIVVSISKRSVIKGSTVVVLLEYLGLRVVVFVVSFCATD